MGRKRSFVLRVAADPRAVIPGAALLAVLPILVYGQSCGHDFDFHLLSWLEAARSFTQGVFPHWAYTPAFNAGEPRFLFYPPLSWIVGATLGLMLPWTLVPAAFTWIALSLSGLTFHTLARRYTSSHAATVGAILYLANPYMLFTAYERSAFAELLAAAWLPLLLAAALAPHVRVISLAVPVALLWLTNAPAAVMATYALAVLTVIRLLIPTVTWPRAQPSPKTDVTAASTRLQVAGATSSATALGLALAGFYIIPAAYERRFVQIRMLVIEGMRVSDHFLFHRMPGLTPDDRFHDAVVRTASAIAVTLLAFIAAALLAHYLRGRSGSSTLADAPDTSVVLPLALLVLLIAFLLTPQSLTLWEHLPNLAFLQFPWRLNALLGLILAFLTALALRRRLSRLFSLLFAFLLAALLITPAWVLFHQHCDLEDSVPARVALFRSNLGTDPTDEYTPIDADPDALHPRDPPYWLIPPQDSYSWRNGFGVDAPPPANATPGPSPAHIELDLPGDRYLVLNRRKYPFWQVLLNGKPQNQDEAVHQELLGKSAGRDAMWVSDRQDGLIVLKVPAGHSAVDLVYRRTADESTGILISGLAFVVVLILCFRPRGISPASLRADTSLATRA